MYHTKYLDMYLKIFTTQFNSLFSAGPNHGAHSCGTEQTRWSLSGQMEAWAEVATLTAPTPTIQLLQCVAVSVSSSAVTDVGAIEISRTMTALVTITGIGI